MLTQRSADIRAQVQERIIDVMREAEEQGLNGMKAAEKAFPGTPEMVILLAAVELESRQTEGWWQQVERTIEGEVINRALAAGNG